MLKDERLSKILKLVNERGNVTTSEVSDGFNISLATARRDINELDSLNKLVKVFGGASSIKNAQYITTEDNMDVKSNINIEEKKLIGKYAASLIENNDFIYLDAGTGVESIIPYIEAKNTIYMTNSITTAKKLSDLSKKVFIPPGEFKSKTDALVGSTTCDYLEKYNFTLGFFGTNGIHENIGFTTPDINEAMVKTKAISRCKKAYILADSSKFGKISQVTFSNDPNLEVITNVKNEHKEEVVIKKYKEDI